MHDWSAQGMGLKEDITVFIIRTTEFTVSCMPLLLFSRPLFFTGTKRGLSYSVPTSPFDSEFSDVSLDLFRTIQYNTLLALPRWGFSVTMRLTM